MFKHLFLLVFGSLLYAPVSGQFTLLDRNPFGNAREVVQEPQRVVASIKGIEELVEFVGSYKLKGERKFSLNFKEVDQKKWLQVADALFGITVVDYYEDEQVLVVDYQGNKGRLKLRDRSTLVQSTNRRLPATQPGRQGGQGNIRRTPIPPSSRPESSPPGVLPQRVPRPENLPPPPRRLPRSRDAQVSA